MKNERLGFTIPYVHEGRSHEYVPDFLVRLVTEPERRRAHADRRGLRQPQVARARRRPRPTPRATSGARRSTTGASSGRWGYVEVHNPRRRVGAARRSDREPVRRPPDHRAAGLSALQRTAMPPRKTQDRDADAGRSDHPRRQARQPPDRRRPGLRRTRRSSSRSRSATRATRRSTRSSSGRARTSSTARTSSPTRRRSTSRRRSTRAS